MRAPFRLALRLVTGAILIVGWLALFLAIALFAAEKSGFLTSYVRDAARSRMGSIGDDLTIREVRWCWFESAIALEGIDIGPHSEWLHVDAARLDFELFADGGPRVHSCELQGGRVRISRAFVDAFQSSAGDITVPGHLASGPRAVPSIRIEDLDIELETSHFGVLPIGHVDALLRADPRGRPELWGRIVPSLAGSAAESGKIFLHGKLGEGDLFEVRATATHLPIGTDYLPSGTDLEVVRQYDPRGTFELDAAGIIGLDGKFDPRVHAQMQIHDGSLRLGADGRHVENVALDLETWWTPSSLDKAFDPRAWRVESRLHGSIEGSDYDVVGFVGPDAGAGALAKAWIHAARLPIGSALLDMCGNTPSVTEAWRVFEPRGACEAWIGARIPSDFQRGEDPLRKVQLFGAAHFDGRAGMTYHGFAHTTGVRDSGFPLPLEKVSGDLVCALNRTRLRPLKVALVDLSGDSGSSLITAKGLVQSHAVDVPPFSPGYGYSEFDLDLATKGLAVDDRLRRALEGLSGSLPPATTWEPFQPRGGSVDVEFRIAHTVEMPFAGIDLDVQFHDVALAWRELPIPVTPTRARLTFEYDGHAEKGLGFALDGSLQTAPRLHLAGRLQSDSSATLGQVEKHIDDCELFQVEVERVSLTGDDQKTLVAHHPEIGAEMDEMAPKGFANVSFGRVRAARDAITSTRVEVTPRDPVQLTPKRFQMITSAVHGRVLVGSDRAANGAENVRSRLMPLVGTWGANVPIAFTARFPERTVTVCGAGIDPSSKSLLGSLRQAMSSPGSVPVDMTSVQVKGAIDFVGEIKIGDTPTAKNVGNYRFFVHDSELATADGFALDHLRGELKIQNEELYGENLSAWLANTPVSLRDTRLESSPEGFRLETRFDATGVPIDRDHLGAFVDPKTLDALLDGLNWRGTLDVRDGRIVVSVPTEGSGRLEFSGAVVPHDMSIQLGLPISVSRASAKFEKLIYEGGRVRAIVHIDDFDGLVADRELSSASMSLTYVEPKLSVENLAGRLEGGQILPLGADASRRGTVFSIALRPPFDFQLALGLKSVEAGALLRGLFPSDMATRGRIDADLRLSGDMDHLLGIAGSGSIKVLESRLWSVPVFRALFAQLGLDDTAVFDSMATNVFVRDGSVEMRDITLRSPLLQLVGSGALDFDGGLKYDLEVRYDLIDRLGPFTRILYSIQNKLLSVAIRGDMARPEIIFENPFTSLFGRRDRDKRPLPLPPWAPLPPRF